MKEEYHYYVHITRGKHTIRILTASEKDQCALYETLQNDSIKKANKELINKFTLDVKRVRDDVRERLHRALKL